MPANMAVAGSQGDAGFADELAFSSRGGDNRFAMREPRYVRSLRDDLPWMLGICLVLAVIGPFGTFDSMTFAYRLPYFLTTGVSTWLLVVGLVRLMLRLEAFDRWHTVARMALAGALAAVPGALVVFAMEAAFRAPLPPRALLWLIPNHAVLTISISVVIGLFIQQRLHQQADVERARVADLPAQAAEPEPASFFRRIPPALGRDLLALEMQDHYLRIHTAVGSDLILLRLRDAIAELGEAAGLRVHRSWWVAHGAVRGANRDGQRLSLVLRNGLEVPVSKTWREAVKTAGWSP
jgi:DNA-binding LytR/AlgR family response regulator